MKWLYGTKTLRLESLKAPGGVGRWIDTDDFKHRLTQPHVLELAKSIKENAGAPAHLTVVEWKTKELVIGGDRTAALALNGLKPGELGGLEVRAFEGSAEDIIRQRAHENAFRRHDDRDAWLRSLVDREAERIARERERKEPPTLPLPFARPQDRVDYLAVTGIDREHHTITVDELRHKWVQANPNGTACGEGAPPDPAKVHGWEGVTCQKCLANAPPGVATSAEPPLCLCGHAQAQHGDFGAPNCTECTCELYEAQAPPATTEGAYFIQPVVYQDGDEPPCPKCSATKSTVRWQGGYQCTNCGEKWGGFQEERVVAMADSDPCAKCGHRADEHEMPPEGCGHKRCDCMELVPPVRQQSGTPARPLPPSQPVTVTKADKAKARKLIAEKEKTTPAALKQAEHRDRVSKGQARQKHDDSGPTLTKERRETQKALITVDAYLQRAITGLKNLAEKRPSIAMDFDLKARAAGVALIAKGLRDDRKGSGL